MQHNTFSYNLVQQLKKSKGIKHDYEAALLIPHMNSGNLSAIKHGNGRNLTEQQALYIAKACELNPTIVLVQLAAETADDDEVKDVWLNLEKLLNERAKEPGTEDAK